MPVHERQDIPHHLMDFLEPEEEYKVTDFQNDATRCVSCVHMCAWWSQSHISIIDRGSKCKKAITSGCWRHQLLYSITTLAQHVDHGPRNTTQTDRVGSSWYPGAFDPFTKGGSYHGQSMASFGSTQDYTQPTNLLSDGASTKRDYQRAARTPRTTWSPSKVSHVTWNNTTCIEFSLGLIRFKSLIFWLYADPSKLNPRLDDRVDTMINVRIRNDWVDNARRKS